MKTIVSLLGLISSLAIPNAFAWERVRLDTYTASQNWEISSQDLGLKPSKPFSVRMRTLHGGRQEGVCIVDIDSRYRPLTKELSARSPIGRHTSRRHGTTTKQSSMSCLTVMKTARHWQFCTMRLVTLVSAWASTSNNYRSSLYGETQTPWGRDMSRAWNPAPAGPTTAVINVR
jgi:hypothetical protein